MGNPEQLEYLYNSISLLNFHRQACFLLMKLCNCSLLLDTLVLPYIFLHNCDYGRKHWRLLNLFSCFRICRSQKNLEEENFNGFCSHSGQHCFGWLQSHIQFKFQPSHLRTLGSLTYINFHNEHLESSSLIYSQLGLGENLFKVIFSGCQCCRGWVQTIFWWQPQNSAILFDFLGQYGYPCCWECDRKMFEVFLPCFSPCGSRLFHPSTQLYPWCN